MIRSPDPCACPIREVGPSMAGSCPGQVLLFMTVLEAFINGRCDLADPCNRVTSKKDPDSSYDFVVAGGGTAGSVVAARLSENPEWKVLLIEAGGDEPVPSSVPAWVTSYWGREDTDWMYQTETTDKACLDSGGNCSWTRAKMLGGCSVTNGMMYMRGHAADYDGWAVNGATGWSWVDVLPYFLKSENNKEIGKSVSAQYHATGGPLPVQKFNHAPRFAHDVVSAAIELGYPPTSDLNGETITGFTIAQTLNDHGSRYSTARAFLRPAAKRPNLHVLLNAHVTRVLIDPLEKSVSAVEYLQDGQTKTVGVRKEAIISGGTINSPQILMLSGVGPKETLDRFSIPTFKELPGVGQNLHNHVGVNLEFTLNKELDTNELTWSTAMDYMLRREGALSSTGMSQLTGIVNSRMAAAGGRHPDIQFFFSGYWAGCSDGFDEDPLNLADAPKRQISISAIALQPRSRGYLTIRSIDPMDKPLLQPHYFNENHEMDVLVDACRIAYRLANTTIMREKYGMVPTEGYGAECEGGGPNPSDDYFKCLARTHTAPENHQVGTCKIGSESDPMAVVDMELRVHGIKGLRVIDASVMPTVVSGNTAAPTIMIAERGAEFIKQTHKRSISIPDPDNRFGTGDNGFNTFGIDFSGNKDQNDDRFDGYHYDKIDNNAAGTDTDRFINSQSNKPDRWRPWDKEWPNQQWPNKGQFEHNREWHDKHRVPINSGNNKKGQQESLVSGHKCGGSLPST